MPGFKAPRYEADDVIRLTIEVTGKIPAPTAEVIIRRKNGTRETLRFGPGEIVMVAPGDRVERIVCPLRIFPAEPTIVLTAQ